MGRGLRLRLTGFTEDELNALMSSLEDGSGPQEGEDDIPETPEDPISRPGDLWILGNHRLLCGDSTVVTDYEKVLGGVKADLCFCDPPYNVDYAGGVGAEKAGKGRRIKNDALMSSLEDAAARRRVRTIFRKPQRILSAARAISGSSATIGCYVATARW
jgi:hypothetical protein